jgi:hypothetical protein
MSETEGSDVPDEREVLVDPEPFSVFLAAAGFLGSVASIASYIEFRRQQARERREDRGKLLNEARDLFMSLEVDTMQIEASLQKLEVILVAGTSSLQRSPYSGARFEFGSIHPIFTYQGFRKYQEVLLELNRLVGRSLETVSTLLQKLYNLDVQFAPEEHQRLISLQSKLNGILRQSMSYEDGFRTYYEVIGYTRDVLRRLRSHVDRAE